MQKNINFKVEQDQDPESPREWDNLGTMVCSHRRYELGDDQFNPDDYEGWDELKKELVENLNAVVVLPLYLYDHSGITMYTDGDTAYRQHEAWDAGQVGFIYVSEEDVIKEYGSKSKKNLALAEKVLKAEIETYDQYLRGDIWCVTVEDEDGEVIDSLCGLYGDEAVEEYKKEYAGESIKS